MTANNETSANDNNNNYIKGLSTELEQYNAGLAPPIPEPPRTFVIECNKTLAQQDGDSLRTNAWTNNFPPIKLKKGDVVSVNSAFLSTRGSGDLLQFDDTNNKTRLLFEYYATNDNTNNKKPSYNIRGATNSSSYVYTAGVETNCYPVNYRPMRLYRLLETFKSKEDYETDPQTKTIQFTDPLRNDAFYSKVKEAFWGYQHCDDFIFNGVEDKYIPSLFRPPLVNIRETMFCSFNSETELDPTIEPYFGLNLKALKVWYISTQHSLFGPPSSNATMRIYFGYASGGSSQLQEMNASTFNFLRRLRVGQFIQFKDADQVFGLYGSLAQHKNTSTGAITSVGGSSCYYCSGYATLGDGVVRPSDSIQVDRFTQMGQVPPAIGSGATSVPSNLYNMSLKNPLGSIMKLVKINLVNGTTATRNGVASIYSANQGAQWNDHGHMNMPFIEVQCDSAISIAFNNPNLAHISMIPSMGDAVADSSPTAEGVDLYCSKALQLGVRSWFCGANKSLTRVAKLTGSTLQTQYRNEFGTADMKPYPTNEYESAKAELNEKMYLAFRPNYYSVQDGTSEVDGDYYGSPNADKYASMDNAYGMRLVEDGLINYGLPPNPNLADMLNVLGISAGESRFVAHNYNIGALNKDGTLNPTAYGNDILETISYKGGRSPTFYRGFNPDLYDTPIGSATRIGYHNQGQSYNIYSTSNNRNRTGGFFGKNCEEVRTLEARTPNNQRKLQTDGNLYIENQSGLNTQFHFGNTILDTDVIYNGDSMPNQLATPFSASQKTTNVNYANGTANFIVGAKNLPKAYHKDGGTDIDYPSGLWYGYASATDNFYRRPFQKGGYGLDQGILDFRFPMSQMPSLFYAKFVNALGQTEIMYCQCVYQSITINDGTTNNDYNNGNFTNFYHDPSILFTDASSAINDCCAPALFIIKRDCENTGLKKFLGIDANADGSMRTFSLDQYNPKISEPTNSNKPTQLGSYFEILNEYAMAEHQVKFDNLERDLVPLSPIDLTDDTEYQNNFGVNTSQFGNKCGGDFYLCKYPNMPFDDNTGIRRVVDSQIRLCAENIKRGEPTRIDGISNYTGNGHTGKYEWGIHYDYIDLDISGDKVYYSPSDVASYITSQLHKPADLYKSWDTTLGGGGRFVGGQWENSAGSYPMNALFRSIHGPSDELGAGTSSYKGNEWDSATGMLKNTYHEGDFIFFSDVAKEVFENGINAFGYEGGGLRGLLDTSIDLDDSEETYQVPSSGKHPVWIQNNNFFLNTLPTTDSFNIDGYGYSEPTSSTTIRNFYNEQEMRGKDMRRKQYTFSQTFGSMFVGTNNAQLNYNTNISRFEWKFLHQPNYSIFTEDHSSGATSGGNIIAKIWTERIKGYDNWDRYGGVNITNWCMPITSFNLAKSKRDVINDPLTYKDPIGNAFMNKLGFSNTWITSNQGSTDYDDVSTYSYSTCYKPLGTTASDYDISQAKPYTQTNPLLLLANADGYPRREYLPPTSDAEKLAYLQVDNSLNSLGGKSAPPPPLSATSVNNSYNGAIPFGNVIPSGTTTYDRSDFLIKNLGASLGYGLVNTKGSPPSVRYDAQNANASIKVPTDLNLDDVKFFSYDIEVDSNSIQADELPKKTLIGYFLIMSNIIDKHEFIGSANNGSPLNCIGILSKNYENSDFYFSFQSPVEFYIKQDRTITSIKTEIMTPQLTDPAGLDHNSSIIYTIVRQNNIPEPDVPPISIQQALDYALMEKMSGQMGIDMGNINPYSNAGQMGLGLGSGGGAGLNLLRQNLVDAVLHPSQGSASMIFATQSAISSHISRMGIGARAKMLREGLSEDPNDPLLQIAPPTPAQAQIEGLGIAEPTSLAPMEAEPYLSEAQLEIQNANAIKGSGPDPEDSASSAGSVFSGLGVDTEDTKSISDLQSNMNSDFSTIKIGARHRADEPTGTIGEFFREYMNGASDNTKKWYAREQRAGRFDVDNPKIWSKQLLGVWSQDWGDKTHKGIGMRLGAEGKGQIKSALSRYEQLTPKELESSKEQQQKPRVEAIETEFGNETLRKRISRSQIGDKNSRQDEKKLMSFSKQNPYDLRTWDNKTISSYMEDKHHGIKEAHRTPQNKLMKQGHDKLREEKERRDKGGKGSGKIQITDNGEYKNKSYQPAGYSHLAKHLTPHESINHSITLLRADPPKPQVLKEGGKK